ncbi:MAG: hypothetical protein PHW27_00525 [Melioribacteraceae bacterium]|nr:hypothetical protein [Melioribacteraceae bacterium]
MNNLYSLSSKQPNYRYVSDRETVLINARDHCGNQTSKLAVCYYDRSSDYFAEMQTNKPVYLDSNSYILLNQWQAMTLSSHSFDRFELDNDSLQIKVIDGVQPYQIGLSSIRDKRDVVNWVYHLSSKNWITKEIIQDFILLCSIVFNFDLRI